MTDEERLKDDFYLMVENIKAQLPFLASLILIYILAWLLAFFNLI